MITIYKTHIVFNIGKNWLSIDRSGVMTWDTITNKNHFIIWHKIM